MPTPPRHPPSRETVILLHSSAASARQWDALAEQLRPRFDVHAIDLHGHGSRHRWQGERALSLQDEAALVLPVIESAGGAHLIGHSYGGAVALTLAAARPAQVRSLAVYEPVLFGLLAEHEPQGQAAGEAFGLAQRMRELVAAGQASDAAARFIGYWSGAAAWSRLDAQRQASIAARMDTVVQHFDALYAEALPAARLARLRMPVLCLAGDRSTPAATRIAALLRELLPAARHQALPGLAHMGPMTHAALVNEHLLSFLGAHTLSRHAGQPSGLSH
jgi:pimeloyl-ACP methyl ester carboxylesterase